MLLTVSEGKLIFATLPKIYWRSVKFVRRVDPSSILIVAGEHSLSQESGLEQNRFVINTTVHEKYDFLTYENDISLLFVSKFLNFEN
jgi:hypothetical protein